MAILITVKGFSFPYSEEVKEGGEGIDTNACNLFQKKTRPYTKATRTCSYYWVFCRFVSPIHLNLIFLIILSFCHPNN